MGRLAGARLTVIHGDGDFIAPDDTAELRAVAREVVLADTGHFPFDEQPEALRAPRCRDRRRARDT